MMKKKLFLFLLILVLFSCQNREWDNPFDPSCPKEIFTPGSITATQQGNQIVVTWTQSNKTISGFRLSQNMNDGTWSVIAESGKAETTQTVNNIEGGKKYGFKIIAVAGKNESNEKLTYITPILLPALSTTAVSAITSATAASGGNIISDGGASITARGVCWGTTQSPTITQSKTTDGTGTGTFTSALTGLAGGTTYYVRAYATNSVGTAYGIEVSFKTNANLPSISTGTTSATSCSTASSGGTISNDGGSPVTAKGVCWSTTQNPTITSSKTSDGSGTGSFPSSLTGLTANTTYYVRAYATNSAGTSYGSQVSFTTPACVSMPTVTTAAASGVTATGATLGGNVVSDGNASVTERGICYSTTQNPTTANNKTAIGSGTGTFSSAVSGLAANTTYYVRAYATNSTGTGYGEEVSFRTNANMPTITTGTTSATNCSTATSGGNISNDGGSPVTGKGVCWSTTQNPTIANNKTTDGLGTGIFSSILTGLAGNTTYYVRAYATNSAGTSYGSQVSFITPACVSLATVTTAAATMINSTGATLGGNITNDGNASVTERGICFSTSQNPTTANNKTTIGSGTGTFNSAVSGLAANTAYYVRAYAINSQGIAYGSQISFTTQTSSLQTITDVEGNTYNIVTIGSQVWMAENLRTTKYSDETSIPNVTDNTTWSNINSGAYCWFNNDEDYKANFGALYNWFAINSKKLCPYGWQVPSDDEWTILNNFLGGYEKAGGMMKSRTGWNSPNEGATNSSGFSGLPGSYRWYGGTFPNYIGEYGMWWSSSEVITNVSYAWFRGLGSGTPSLSRQDINKKNGYSVRCIKDTEELVSLPSINTSSVTEITFNSAIFGGNVTNDGNASVTERGVCYSTTQNPTTTNNKTAIGSGIGAFNTVVSGLAANTTYYLRAYAINSQGTAYGTQISFTTNLVISLPTVTTAAATGITTTGATLGGNVTNDGNATVTERGVCYSTTQNPTTANNKTGIGSGTGTFNSAVSGLAANTTYYVRAYAINSQGTAFGSQISFATNPVLSLPTVTTAAATEISSTVATLGGNVTNDGNATVTERGVCYSTTQNPTTANNKTAIGSGIGTFNSAVPGLAENTTYYVRAYAINSLGTAYGTQVSLITLEALTGTFIDSRDNQIYKWIKIGTQTWMAQNLAYLPHVTQASDVSENNPKYYVYSYQFSDVNQAKVQPNYITYGAIYNWVAAQTACPSGWHLPSDSEWNILINFLGGTEVAGGKIKAIDKWDSPNIGATNTSCFSAIPGGWNQPPGIFTGLGSYAQFWTSTKNSQNNQLYYRLYYYYSSVVQNYGGTWGNSVRCIKD